MLDVVKRGLLVYLLSREETVRSTHEVSKMTSSTTNISHDIGVSRLFRAIAAQMTKLTYVMTRRTQIEWAA